MSEKCYIAVKYADGSFRCIDCWNYGQPSRAGRVLVDHYIDPDKVEQLLDLGDIRELGPHVDRPHKDGGCRLYENANPSDDYIPKFPCFAEPDFDSLARRVQDMESEDGPGEILRAWFYVYMHPLGRDQDRWMAVRTEVLLDILPPHEQGFTWHNLRRLVDEGL